ncbi:MAG TPA: hypothetical protein VGD43_13070, partial [Micromonospora sp.]
LMGVSAGCGRPGGGDAAAPATESGTSGAATTAPAGSAADPTPTPTGTVPSGASPSATRKPASPKPGGTPKQPASFDPSRHITDLVTTTTGLRLGKPVDGIRHGELVVTVRNAGPYPVWHLTMTVEVPESMTADGGDWAGCTRLASTRAGFPAGSKCDKGYLGVGQTRVFHLRMKSPASKDSADSRVSRWIADTWSGDGRSAIYRDRDPHDNRRIFLVYRA